MYSFDKSLISSLGIFIFNPEKPASSPMFQVDVLSYSPGSDFWLRPFWLLQSHAIAHVSEAGSVGKATALIKTQSRRTFSAMGNVLNYLGF